MDNDAQNIETKTNKSLNKKFSIKKVSLFFIELLPWLFILSKIFDTFTPSNSYTANGLLLTPWLLCFLFYLFRQEIKNLLGFTFFTVFLPVIFLFKIFKFLYLPIKLMKAEKNLIIALIILSILYPTLFFTIDGYVFKACVSSFISILNIWILFTSFKFISDPFKPLLSLIDTIWDKYRNFLDKREKEKQTITDRNSEDGYELTLKVIEAFINMKNELNKSGVTYNNFVIKTLIPSYAFFFIFFFITMSVNFGLNLYYIDKVTGANFGAYSSNSKNPFDYIFLALCLMTTTFPPDMSSLTNLGKILSYILISIGVTSVSLLVSIFFASLGFQQASLQNIGNSFQNIKDYCKNKGKISTVVSIVKAEASKVEANYQNDFIDTKMEELKDKLNNTEEILKNNIYNIFTGLLVEISEKIKFIGDEKRISIYIFRNDSFVMIGRYSENRTFAKKGRTIYPFNEGFIGKSWEKGEDLNFNLINAHDDDAEKYVSETLNACIIKQETLKNLKMKSSSYFIKVLKDESGNKKAIIVLETLERYYFNNTEKINEINQGIKEYLNAIYTLITFNPLISINEEGL